MAVVIVLSINRKKEVYHFLTIPESYYLKRNYPTFDVSLYSSNENDYYFKEDVISSLNLKSKSLNDSYMLQINQIIEEDEVILHNDLEYYKYRLNVTFPIDLESSYQISDAYIELNYSSDEKLCLDIGNIIFYEEELNNKISIRYMKPIVNFINDFQIITGIGLTISCDKDVVIKEIIPLDKRVFVKNSQITYTDKSDYSNQTNIETLINDDYEPTLVDNEKLSIEMEKNVVNHYVVPLGYTRLESINVLGFKIKYIVDGIEEEQLIYPFKYFSGIVSFKEEVYVRSDS
jgi:hypothetical protein